MIYGYCRISTKKQSIERQVSNIQELYPNAIILKEEYTGTKIDRPVWSKLYSKLKPNDTVIFDEVSRMSRNADEGFALYQELFKKKVHLVFLKEPHINTSVYNEAMNNTIQNTGNEIADIYIKATNEVLMILAEKQIKLAFEQAQKEVEYLQKRTSEALEKIQEKNKLIELGLAEGEIKRIGTPKGTKLVTKKSIKAKEGIKKYNKSFGGFLNDIETIKQLGISRKTFYKYKKELNEEQEKV